MVLFQLCVALPLLLLTSCVCRGQDIDRKKRFYSPCTDDEDCPINRCCARAFGVNLCRTQAGVGEMCSPIRHASHGSDPFTECGCQPYLECTGYSTSYMCTPIVG